MMGTITTECIVPILIVVAIQIYWSRSLLGLPIPFKALCNFTILQTLAIVTLLLIIPLTSLAVIIASISGMILLMYFFDAELFPEALFCIVGPAALTLLGELVFPPLFLKLWPDAHYHSYLLFATGYSEKPFLITAFIPSILLALFFFVKPNKPNRPKRLIQKTSKDWKKEIIKKYGCFFPMILLHETITIMAFNYILPGNYIFANVFFYSGILMFPVISIALIQSSLGSKQYQKLIRYHSEKYQVQQSALQVLREERHDYLNELTLISSYVQMNKWKEAHDCISYAAANLSDRYNYATLPHDAWLTVLEFKQKEAKRRKINFEVLIAADPPTDFAEQRLLPKLIMNLIDNAFAAASKTRDPQVELIWYEHSDGSRSLQVSNNGAPIPEHLSRQIYQGGYTSKKNTGANNGWGLVICKKIAEELGGQLCYESTHENTSFVLTLPKTQNAIMGA